jgi:hypothetical protein
MFWRFISLWMKASIFAVRSAGGACVKSTAQSAAVTATRSMPDITLDADRG